MAQGGNSKKRPTVRSGSKPAPRPHQAAHNAGASSSQQRASAEPQSERIDWHGEAAELRAQLGSGKIDAAIGSTLVAFVLILVLLGLLAPDSAFSGNENRSLATWPSLTLASLADGSYASDVQSYVSDQFFARDGWISLKLAEDKLKGVRESNGVYLGDNGYLIESATVPVAKNVDKNVQAINAFSQYYSDLNMDMVIVPDAVCVLSDYLPANAPVHDQRSDMAMLSAKIDDTVNFVDVTPDLAAHKSEGIYYKTDHHWTSLGAYYAFNSIADDLGIDNVSNSYDVYTVSDSFEGTMASKCGSHDVKDSIDVYVPKDTGVDYYVTYDSTRERSRSMYKSSALQQKDQYTVFFGGNYSRVTIRTTNYNGKCLLMFKDSYANSLVQFLTPYYEEIILIDPRYYYENVSTIISNEGVTDVLFLYNMNTYLGDTSLGDVLNAAISPKESEQSGGA